MERSTALNKYLKASCRNPLAEAPRTVVPEDNNFCNGMEGEVMADKLIIYGKVG